MSGEACDDCGAVPFFTVHDGKYVIRCQCDTAVVLGPVETTPYIPETWAP